MGSVFSSRQEALKKLAQQQEASIEIKIDELQAQGVQNLKKILGLGLLIGGVYLAGRYILGSSKKETITSSSSQGLEAPYTNEPDIVKAIKLEITYFLIGIVRKRIQEFLHTLIDPIDIDSQEQSNDEI